MTDTPRWLLAPMLVAGSLLLGPQAVRAQAPERNGKAVVDEQCAKCHAKGEGGAPKIGDRAAWAPRMKRGMDALALSAIRGHGGMPARGSRANLTDGEIKAAINYMFNPASAAAAKAAPAKSAAGERAHRLVGGVDIYLGLMRAPERKGKGYYHVSIVLRDHASKAEIKDAQVEGRVATPMTGETKKLEPETVNNAFSYGNYFQLPGKDPYTLTLQIRRPGAPAPVEAKFDLKR